MATSQAYRCPIGHVIRPHRSDFAFIDWKAAPCDECTIQKYGRLPTSGEFAQYVFYSREEWIQGAQNQIALSNEINLAFANKPAHCEICNKNLKATNDKAYHLAKHFTNGIPENWQPYIHEVIAQ